MTTNSLKHKSGTIFPDHNVITLEISDKIKARITQNILAMMWKRTQIVRPSRVNESPTKNKTWGTAKKVLEEKYTLVNA